VRPWRSAIVCIFPIIITSIFSFPIIPQLRHATFQQQAIRPVCYPSFPPVASRPSSTLIPSPLPSPSRLLHVFLSPSPLQSTPCQTRLRDSRPSPFLHLSEPSHNPSPSRYSPPPPPPPVCRCSSTGEAGITPLVIAPGVLSLVFFSSG